MMQGLPSSDMNSGHIFTDDTMNVFTGDTMDADTILYYPTNQDETTSAEIHQLLGNHIQGSTRYFLDTFNGDKTLPENSSLHGSSSELSEIFTENDQVDVDSSHLLDDLVLKSVVTINSPVKPKRSRRNSSNTEIRRRRKRQSQDEELPRLRKKMLLTDGGCALGEKRQNIENLSWKCQHCSAVFRNCKAFYLHRVSHRKKKLMHANRAVDANLIGWNRTKPDIATDEFENSVIITENESSLETVHVDEESQVHKDEDIVNDDKISNSNIQKWNKRSDSDQHSLTLYQNSSHSLDEDCGTVMDIGIGNELAFQNENVNSRKYSEHLSAVNKNFNSRSMHSRLNNIRRVVSHQGCARTTCLYDAIANSKELKYSEHDENYENDNNDAGGCFDDEAESDDDYRQDSLKDSDEQNDYTEFEQQSSSNIDGTCARIQPIYEAIAMATQNQQRTYIDDEFDRYPSDEIAMATQNKQRTYTDDEFDNDPSDEIAMATQNKQRTYTDDEFDNDPSDENEHDVCVGDGFNDKNHPESSSCHFMDNITPHEQYTSDSLHQDSSKSTLLTEEDHCSRLQDLDVGVGVESHGICSVSQPDLSGNLSIKRGSRVSDFETHLKIIQLSLCARVQPYLINVRHKQFNGGRDVVDSSVSEDGDEDISCGTGSECDLENGSVEQVVMSDLISDESRHGISCESQYHGDCARTQCFEFHRYVSNKTKGEEASRHIVHVLERDSLCDESDRMMHEGQGHTENYVDFTCTNEHHLKFVDRISPEQAVNNFSTKAANTSSPFESLDEGSIEQSNNPSYRDRKDPLSFEDCVGNCDSLRTDFVPKSLSSSEDCVNNYLVPTAQCLENPGWSSTLCMDNYGQSTSTELVAGSCSRVQTFQTHVKLKQNSVISIENCKNMSNNDVPKFMNVHFDKDNDTVYQYEQGNSCQSIEDEYEPHLPRTLETMSNMNNRHADVHYTYGETQTLSSVDEEEGCVTYESHVGPPSDSDNTVIPCSNITDLCFQDNRHLIYDRDYYKSPKKRWWDTYINEKD